MDPDVVKLVGMCVERDVDVSEAIFLPDVCEEDARELIPALESSGSVVSVVLVDDALELISWQQTEELGEHVWAGWHEIAPGELGVRRRHSTGNRVEFNGVRLTNGCHMTQLIEIIGFMKSQFSYPKM